MSEQTQTEPISVDDLTPDQLKSSARGWHEIAAMVDAGASDEEIATVARATVYRDGYGVEGLR